MNDLAKNPALTTSDERLFFRTGEDPVPEPESPIHDIEAPPDRHHRKPKSAFTVAQRWRVYWRTLVRSLTKAVVTEVGIGTPFLFLPVAVIIGVVVYFILPAEPAPWNTPAGIVVLAGVYTLVRGARPVVRLVALAAIVSVSGMALAQAYALFRPTPMLGSDVTTRLTGRIVAVEERANGRTRFTIDVIGTERPKLRYAPGRVRVTAPGTARGYDIGGGITGVVRLTSPSGPAHPGGYDFAFHSYFDGIGANGFFLGNPVPATIADTPRTIQRIPLLVERMRQSISAEIRSSTTGRASAVSTALITGNKSGIPDDVTEALRVSGLAHILSISGLHMALVAATVMATLRLGFAFSPNWSSRRPVKKYAAAGALIATGFYLFLAGAGVATQRSFVMLAVMLFALTFDRAAVTLRNLALAALAVMLISPDEVVGPGFQMSFAATAALIAVYGGWQEWRNRRHEEGRARTRLPNESNILRKIARYALGIAATSLVAGLATGLFASYHFGRIAPYGLLANLAAMPIVTILVMPMAVAAIVIMPFGLHPYPLKLMAAGVELVIAIAEKVAGLSPPISTGQMPATALLFFSAGLAIACLMSTRLRLAALPLFLMGTLLWRGNSLPVAVISEDARQFAVIESGEGGLRFHVNRTRPNSFIIDQWQEAYGNGDIIKPKSSDLITCNDTMCEAAVEREGARIRIAYVQASPKRGDGNTTPGNVTIFPDPCAGHDLVIFAEAPSPTTCANGIPVISAKELALRGSAEIGFHPGAKNRIIVRHALPGPVRPWLDHRRYSRPARNLAAWRPRRAAQ